MTPVESILYAYSLSAWPKGIELKAFGWNMTALQADILCDSASITDRRPVEGVAMFIFPLHFSILSCIVKMGDFLLGVFYFNI
jgi:hypothetical protein